MDGAQVPVSVPLSAPCATCRGTGAKPGHLARGLQPLPRAAAWRPSRRASSRSRSPAASAAAPAPRSRSPCPTCSGTGRTRQVKRYRVNIPAGVRDGSRVRLAGKGEAGPRGGPQGDLYVVTRVGESRHLRAQGRQPRGGGADHDPRGDPRGHDRGAHARAAASASACPRAPSTARSSGCAARARRKLGGRGRGDIRYRLVVDVPRSLSREQAEVVDELATVMDGNPRARLLSGKGRVDGGRGDPEQVPRRLHDLGGRRARRDAPPDAADLRGARADHPQALAQEHAPLLAGGRARGSSGSRSSPASWA